MEPGSCVRIPALGAIRKVSAVTFDENAIQELIELRQKPVRSGSSFNPFTELVPAVLAVQLMAGVTADEVWRPGEVVSWPVRPGRDDPLPVRTIAEHTGVVRGRLCHAGGQFDREQCP